MSNKLIDELSNKYGGLTVLARAKGKGSRGDAYWRCLCSCGNEKVVRGDSLRSGSTMSCGCLRNVTQSINNLKHGKTRSAEYRAWLCMKGRCSNPNMTGYHRYGGRGITFDPSWSVFENFYRDMGVKPSVKHSLDRLDNNLGYSKENCRWATSSQQNNNRRDNRLITCEGVTQTLAQWTRLKNIKYRTLDNRLRRGWTPNDALNLSIPLKEAR